MLWRKKLKLDSGDVSFVLPNGDRWNVDLLVLKLTAQDLEQRHEIVDGGKIPLAFLVDLCEAFNQLGCADCTPTLARQVWLTSVKHFEKLDAGFRQRLAKSVR